MEGYLEKERLFFDTDWSSVYRLNENTEMNDWVTATRLALNRPWDVRPYYSHDLNREISRWVMLTNTLNDLPVKTGKLQSLNMEDLHSLFQDLAKHEPATAVD